MKTSGILKLYRGQLIPTEELQKLRKSIGTLISTNGFFSTSRRTDVAIGFARQLPAGNDMEICIFEIDADATLRDIVFADIDHYSKIKGEQEVLFGLNTTFKIDRVEMDDALQMWKICLTTTAEGASRIDQYMKLQEDDMKHRSPLISFGRLLLKELGQVDRAESYFNKLLYSLPSDHSDLPSVHDNIGHVYRTKGELNLALKHYEEAHRLHRVNLPANHPLIADSLNNIGLIYQDKGDFDRALEYLHQALAVDEKNYSGDHSNKCRTILNIGLAYQSKEELDNALQWLNRALDMYTRVLPAPHPDIASTLGELGSVYEDKEDLDRAIDFYSRCLTMEEECLPSNHPALFPHLDRLAMAYKMKNSSRIALKFCRKQLASQKAILGDIHPRVATTLMTMAAVCETEDSRRYYQKALSILEKCVPRNELLMIECLGNLGGLALGESKLDEGIAHWKNILDIRRKIHSPDHPEIALQLKRLGSAYFNEKFDYPEALRYYTESLAIYRANFGDKHSNVLDLELQIAQVHVTNGDSSRALECHHRVLKIREQCLPPGHVDLSESIEAIASIYAKSGTKKGAIAFLEKTKKTQINALGKRHPCVASTMMSIGNILDNNKTCHYYKKALSVLKKSSPPDEERMIECLEALAQIELIDKNFADGIAYLLDALEIQRQIHPSDSLDVADLLSEVADVYAGSSMQNYSEALRYYSESLAIYRAKYPDQFETISELKVKIQFVHHSMAKS